jgi:ABC-type bacteriocin/lantibiotic exporter with double-glycine peptidase domain
MNSDTIISYPETKTESLSDAERKRYTELNLLRDTTKQQTQTLLTHTVKGEHQASISSERLETHPSSIEVLSARTILRQVFIKNLSTFRTMTVIYLIIALLSALLTISIGYVIAHHFVYTDIPTLIQFVFFLASISVSIGVFNIIRTIIFSKFEVSIIYHVQSIIMERLFNLPTSFFEQYATGDLCHRVLMIEPLARLSGLNQIGILLSFAFSTISFLTMLYFSWQLTLATLAIVSVYLFFSVINIKKQLPHIEKYMNNSGDTAAFTFNMNSGMSRIRIFCSEAFAEARWAKLYSDTRQKLTYIYRLGIWRFTITNNMLLFTLTIVFFLGTRWEQNQLPLEYYIIFYSAFIQFMCGLISFSMQLNELAFTICAFRRLKPILTTAPENNPCQNDITSPTEITGAISINNIQFSYPRSKLLILDGFTCAVAKGEHIAIVGLSGAGKSTLLKLLLGFYFPQQGQIFFDNELIQHFNLAELRHKIGVVFQDSKLMTGTLLTNIIDECAGMTEEDAWHAADLVGLKDFITSLPMKMHTMVSQQLNVLSGGQKQLILIARALVGKPRLLLLDEATNSLDPMAQHHIAKVIRRLPITCISIAHRLSAIQYADKIMVLHKGRMTEEGTYHQLLQSQGLFYQLATTQKLTGLWQENATAEA